MAKNKWHLICNAHLDPVWLWRFEEGASEALSTFRAAADFCEEFNGFVFNHNEAILYEWVEENEPNLFKRIQRLVKEEKWNIIGGWYLQPDCNMPQGESFVRQIIWGRRYFKEKFGIVPKTAINFDSFGHSQGLVQILTKSGYDSYIVCRPDKNNFPFSDADFVWKGYDGSEVIVHRSDENYNSIKGKVKEELIDFIDKNKETKTGLFLWGVGNHGGGPSRKDLNGIAELMQSDNDFEIVHSTPAAYFDEVFPKKSEMPVVERGLNPVAPGCYTSQIRIKQKHRKLENEIYAIEKMASSAALQGLCEYPKEEITEAVKDMLIAEFHDALPGSGIRPVEEDTVRVLEHGLEIAARLKMRLFFALCAGQEKLDPTKEEVPVFFYNPHPYPVKGQFECAFVLPKQNWNVEFSYPVASQNGKNIPCQAEIEESNFYMDWCKRAVIEATLEPSSINRVNFSFDIMPKKPTPELLVENGCFVFKTAQVEARVNKKTGLLDKYEVDGVDYLKTGAMKLTVLSDTYNPWGSGNDRYNAGEGVFELMSPEEGSEFSGLSEVIDSVRVVEGGNVRYVVEALFKYKNSKCVVKYTFNNNSSEIGIEADMFYGEKTKMVKLCVPTLLDESSKFIGQTVFGKEELKANGSEKIAQAYVAAVSNDRTLVVVNDGTYGCDMKNGEMRFTLLRSAGYSASDFVLGKTLSEHRYYPRMEQGERIFRFWLRGGGKDILLNADASAALHNQAPYALPFCPSGEGNKPLPLIKICGENNTIQMPAFKKAEKGDKYIVRLQNPQEIQNSADVEILPLGICEKVTFEPFEVKTFAIDIDNKSITECGMADEAFGI